MDGMLLTLLMIVVFLIGMFVGRKTIKTDGMFIISDMDEDVTRWILDVKTDPETIPNRKEIHLKVRKADKRDV